MGAGRRPQHSQGAAKRAGLCADMRERSEAPPTSSPAGPRGAQYPKVLTSTPQGPPEGQAVAVSAPREEAHRVCERSPLIHHIVCKKPKNMDCV